MGSLIKLLICVLVFWFTLWSHVNLQNNLTQLQIQIPSTRGKNKQLKEKLINLQLEIEQFENPSKLLDYLEKPEFSHLYYPTKNQTQTLEVKKFNN